MDICDFHAHILPGADHGSISVEIAVKQLALAKRYGVTRIVATSHFYPHRDSVKDFLDKRQESYKALCAKVPSDFPEVRLGAEVLLCPNMDNLPMLDRLCISGTKTILIELPFNDFGRDYMQTVDNIISAGYDVVLAHAECYNFDNIEALIGLGARLQMNASALTCIFKNKVFESWKARKKLVAIGSDIHGISRKAYQRFGIAKKRLGSYLSVIKEYTDSIWSLSNK